MGIDLERYEGHEIEQDDKDASLSDRMKGIEARNALRDDAPALLAEVVRLRADLAEAVQTLEAIEIAARMRFSPADILDENSPIREGMRAVLAKHGGA